MKKILLALIILAFAGEVFAVEWDELKFYPRKNRNETITAPWTFTDTCYFAEISASYAIVDSVVITYLNANYVDADSMLLQTGGKFYFGTDKTDYMWEYADGSIKFVFDNVDVLEMGASGLQAFYALIDWISADSVESEWASFDSLLMGLGHEIVWDDDADTYFKATGDDAFKAYSGGVEAWGFNNTLFQISREVTVDSNATFSQSVYIDAGDTLHLEGAAGNCYVRRQAGADKIEIFSGAIAAEFNVGGMTFSGTSSGPLIAYSGATATAPTLIPNEAQVTTGIGWTSTGDTALVLITNATSGLYVYEDSVKTDLLTVFNLIYADSIDLNYADITNVITSMTIGGAYIYRAGGTDVPYTDGGTGLSAYSQGDILYATDYNAIGKLAWTGSGKYLGSDIDSILTWHDLATDLAGYLEWSDTTNVILTVSDSTVLSTRISGKADSGAVGYLAQAETIAGDWVNTANPWLDTEIASSATWNARLDTAIIVTWADTADVILTVSDTASFTARIAAMPDSGQVIFWADTTVNMPTYTYLSTNYQPLEATLTDIADGTITEDLINTTNPWADNEVADNITASSYLPLAGGTMTGNILFGDPGTSSNSDTLIFISDNGTEADTAMIVNCYGDDPYLRLFAPSDVGSPTPVMDLKDQKIVLFNGGAGVDYALEFNGADNDGSITYMEDEDRFDFDNDVDVIGDLTAGTITSDGAITASGLTLGSNYRFSDSFVTTAEVDTILNADFASTDYFFLTPSGVSITANDVLSYEAKTDTLIVHRPASGTSGLTYSGFRVK